MDKYDLLYLVASVMFHLILAAHFALRKFTFNIAIRYGWIVYALSIPFAGISIFLLLSGKDWFFWIGGFLFFIWAVFGYNVEYVKKIEWREPIKWQVFIPYIILYLATTMFYWWPAARIYKPVWLIATLLFVLNTYLNISSHKKATP